MVVSSGWKNLLVIQMIALRKIIYGWLKSQKSGSVLREKYLVQMECQPKKEYGLVRGKGVQSKGETWPRCCGACEETE